MSTPPSSRGGSASRGRGGGRGAAVASNNRPSSAARTVASSPSSPGVAAVPVTAAAAAPVAAKKPGGGRATKSAAVIDDDNDDTTITITPSAPSTPLPLGAATKSARPKSAAKKPKAATAAVSSPAVSSSSSPASSSAATSSDEKKSVNPHRLAEPVFTADDLKFFDANGYIILRNAVSAADAEAVVKDIWQFLGFNPAKDGIDACYNPPLNPNALVEMYHSQAQWNNRCNPRVYTAFCQLWGRDDLWCSLDRVGVKLPSVSQHPHYRNKGFTHWDYDVTDDAEYLPMQLQGAMALVDTDVTMGGFHCYPGMHRYLKEWMTEYDVKIEEAAIKRFYTSGFPIKVPEYETCLAKKQHDIVEMKAGDLVIWRGEIAHGNGENLSSRPRMAQYMTMHPQRYSDEPLRAKREECWRKRLPGGQVLWPQLPITNAHGSTGGRGTKASAEQSARRVATLTDLGKLLLGLEPWPDHIAK